MERGKPQDLDFALTNEFHLSATQDSLVTAIVGEQQFPVGYLRQQDNTEAWRQIYNTCDIGHLREHTRNAMWRVVSIVESFHKVAYPIENAELMGSLTSMTEMLKFQRLNEFLGDSSRQVMWGAGQSCVGWHTLEGATYQAMQEFGETEELEAIHRYANHSAQRMLKLTQRAAALCKIKPGHIYEAIHRAWMAVPGCANYHDLITPKMRAYGKVMDQIKET